MQPAKHKFTIFKQIVEIIPAYLVAKLARKHDVERRCRTFSAWSHVVSMLFAHHSHALSLNDIADTLQFHRGALAYRMLTVSDLHPWPKNYFTKCFII